MSTPYLDHHTQQNTYRLPGCDIYALEAQEREVDQLHHLLAHANSLPVVAILALTNGIRLWNKLIVSSNLLPRF